VDTGQLRKEAVAEHPERNRVYSCLGGRQAPRMTVSRGMPLAAGDILLLCSDGVWGPLSSRIIAGVLAEPDLQHAVRQLLDLAELRAGSACDNLSAVAIRWSR
jgi:serine/threonine protein phosphatase PrpC